MLNNLYTIRGKNLSGTPWECYPRPQMRRESYVNLNGRWEFAVSDTPELPTNYPDTILVPFCPESLLSGLHRDIAPGSYLFYRRSLTLPRNFRGGRVLLHVGAADQVSEICVNRKKVTFHAGGYTAFTADITEYLGDANELVIRCFDDLRDLSMPYGKQTLKRGGMWYTPVSGIWQSVWLECVPEVYIERLTITNREYSVEVTISPALEGKVLVPGMGEYALTGGKATITPDDPHLWSPEDPYLYDFTVETATDKVSSYFAIRKIEAKVVNGIPRLLLNGKPYFFHGLLDQGYFPDGIFTPASEDSARIAASQIRTICTLTSRTKAHSFFIRPRSPRNTRKAFPTRQSTETAQATTTASPTSSKRDRRDFEALLQAQAT